MEPPRPGRPIPRLRWLTRADLPRVLEIENDCFGRFSWTKADFEHCLLRPDCVPMVALVGNLLVGSIIYERQPQAFYLLSISVGSPWRMAGIGSTMIAKLVSKMNRRLSIVADVSEYNLGAQLFFKACGFKATEILPHLFELERRGRQGAYRFEFTKAAAAAPVFMQVPRLPPGQAPGRVEP